ncbi:LOW QUALITY PROTEIN: D-tyrosyl-tRNA deacylase [Colletotrichum tofieldiae]|nr:LOW QUALITY PROTEIN: D-tyrosyl-tRNA deacylase [Colletotrichum tofieldiae]GKT90791.1 LOW QUALITY PROTEIN: D-tyrosyl-tRNA deacylase [Colletotrichum tofieldiae]
MKDSLTFTLIVNVLTLFLSAIVQRVLSASVTVDNEVISSIGKGILVLAAVAPGDTEKDAEGLANKVLKLKMWDDEAGGRCCPPSASLSFLILNPVSQFTLFAKIVKNRPDFRLSAPAEEAKKLYHYFLQKVQDSYAVDKVKDGRFQAMMAVSSTNDGPVCAPLNLSQAFGLVR